MASYAEMWAASSLTQSMDDFEQVQRTDTVNRDIYSITYRNPTTGDVVEMHEDGMIFLNGERIDDDTDTQ